jgi:hypothetical protein
MVPPWADDIDSTAGHESVPGSGEERAPDPAVGPDAQIPIAPPGRFRSARVSLGKFARRGSLADLRSALRHYVASGYGGNRIATRRLGRTPATAARLFTALSTQPLTQPSTRDGQPSQGDFRALSAQELIDSVIEVVRPIDGTRDAEAGRAAIRDALSELLDRFPDANLQDLTLEQRILAVERFVAHEVFRLFELDVGNAIRERATSIRAAMARLKEAKDFIGETVASSFRQALPSGGILTREHVAAVVRDSLRETFTVFEAYTA